MRFDPGLLDQPTEHRGGAVAGIGGKTLGVESKRSCTRSSIRLAAVISAGRKGAVVSTSTMTAWSRSIRSLVVEAKNP